MMKRRASSYRKMAKLNGIAGNHQPNLHASTTHIVCGIFCFRSFFSLSCAICICMAIERSSIANVIKQRRLPLQSQSRKSQMRAAAAALVPCNSMDANGFLCIRCRHYTHAYTCILIWALRAHTCTLYIVYDLMFRYALCCLVSIENCSSFWFFVFFATACTVRYILCYIESIDSVCVCVARLT